MLTTDNLGSPGGGEVDGQELRLANALPTARGNETYEQFVLRVNKVFPMENVTTWSRVERLVFNQLMSRLVFEHGYGSISNAMLNKCRDEMFQVVQRYANN